MFVCAKICAFILVKICDREDFKEIACHAHSVGGYLKKKIYIPVQRVKTNLRTDLGLHNQILSYYLNIQNQVRRAYLQKCHCQPREYNFPYRNF